MWEVWRRAPITPVKTPFTAGASSGSRSLPDSAAETQFPLSRFPAPRNRANLFESQLLSPPSSSTYRQSLGPRLLSCNRKDKALQQAHTRKLGELASFRRFPLHRIAQPAGGLWKWLMCKVAPGPLVGRSPPVIPPSPCPQTGGIGFVSPKRRRWSVRGNHQAGLKTCSARQASTGSPRN